ncbi:MAG: hypothetical protein FWG93_06625, partial [Oscillospiraceae bacterium]|nr:hypothetical protein [Oscillospiraceae bacterium]
MSVQKLRLSAAVVFFVLLSFTIVALLYRFDNAVPRVPVYAPGGAADLTEFDFSSSVAHVGEAEFFPGRLLAPRELEEAVPGAFDPAARYYTARVRFLVPEGNYILFGLSPEYASSLYINGEPAGSVGRIDGDGNHIYRVAPFSLAVRPSGGVIELVAQAAGGVRDDVSYIGVYIGT